MGTPIAQNLILFGTLAIQIVTLCYLVTGNRCKGRIASLYTGCAH